MSWTPQTTADRPRRGDGWRLLGAAAIGTAMAALLGFGIAATVERYPNGMPLLVISSEPEPGTLPLLSITTEKRP